MKSGLAKIKPDRKDYSLLHTFGATTTDPEGLPASFSIYDGQPIPNQNAIDTRFWPALPPMPEGCTGEAGAFVAGIQDNKLYNPQDLYLNTPPGGAQGGRDMRSMLQTLIDRGPRAADGTFGPKRTAYFNCYGAGKIDDFDAARIGLWINQYEKRSVFIGSYWYWNTAPLATLPLPSFNTANIPLHCYIAVAWTTDADGTEYLLVIPWVGMEAGNAGVFRLSRVLFNALMAQPNTGCFTETELGSTTPVPIGVLANWDHIVYSLTQFIHNLFGV